MPWEDRLTSGWRGIWLAELGKVEDEGLLVTELHLPKTS